MKGSSKIIMGAALSMVIILAFVLALVLVLLAELYCSLLLRRRKLKGPNHSSDPETLTISTPQQTQLHLVPSPLSSFYAQGVLEAPRSFLFPKLPSKKEIRVVTDGFENNVPHGKGKLHEFLMVQSPHQLGLSLSSSSPSPSYIPDFRLLQKQQQQQPEIAVELEQENNLMYISNPIYDNEAHVDTPFETPESSPSQMDRVGSGSSGDEKDSPPTIKELPNKESCIVRSLGNSISDSNNTQSHIGRSSTSSSGTPCTSPPW